LYYSLWYLYYDVLYGILNNCEVLNKTVSLLNEIPEITDKINATDINLINGRIEFKNVTFSYKTNKDSVNDNTSVNDSLENGSSKNKKSDLDDNDNQNNTNDDETEKDSPPVEVINKDSAIADVSFAVEAGQCLALVGPSGSGKSTIAKLIMRMYNVDEGEILIDHQAISDVTLKSLRSSIGVVPQEVELFSDKVGDNIRYGRPEASDDEVQEAALKAEIHEKIITMDEKYQTKVGNRGLKLSGGERQRVGIGRVFLKNPKIVILDEATSALDTITERKIQSSLEKTYKGKTSVIIAHRLSTICNADQIIVMDKGKIVEKGGHEELIKLGGMYQQMWNQQTESRLQQEKNQSGIGQISVTS
jgi:ABC-type multidrug transport system fused ATPase/permease subunit